MTSIKVGWPPKAASPLLWRWLKAAFVMGDRMCIKFVRVCKSCVGLVNPHAPREGGSINPRRGSRLIQEGGGGVVIQGFGLTRGVINPMVGLQRIL